MPRRPVKVVPFWAVIQTDTESWSVVTAFLRHPVGRRLRETVLDGAETDDLTEADAQAICSRLNEWSEAEKCG